MTSLHGLITLDYGDGTYAFRLTLAGLEEIEAKCDASIWVIAGALQQRQARVKWITETLRVALIGGGLSPVDALALVRRYGDERPLDESRDVAYAVCLAGLARLTPGDQQSSSPGERTAPEKPAPKKRRKTTRASTSAPSAAPAS